MSNDKNNLPGKWKDNVDAFSKPNDDDKLKLTDYANSNDPDYDSKIKDALNISKLKKIRLDSSFQHLIHPFVLFLIGFVFLLIFIVFRYLSIFTEIVVIDVIYEDLVFASGYIFTSVITAIVTEFIAMLKEQDK